MEVKLEVGFFSILSQFLGPNAACTKFHVTKCRIVTPPLYIKWLIVQSLPFKF